MTATHAEHREFWARVAECCRWALDILADEQGPGVAQAVADLLMAHNFRIKTTAYVSAAGDADLDSLRYVVVVPWEGGWARLCEAEWSALGVSEANARDELQFTLLQNGIGVPDDASSLTGSPPD